MAADIDPQIVEPGYDAGELDPEEYRYVYDALVKSAKLSMT